MKGNRTGDILLVLVVLLGISGAVRAQSVIRGKVLDKITKEPLEAAVVTDAATGRNTITDRNGQFTLREASPTDSLILILYRLYVRKDRD